MTLIAIGKPKVLSVGDVFIQAEQPHRISSEHKEEEAFPQHLKEGEADFRESFSTACLSIV